MQCTQLISLASQLYIASLLIIGTEVHVHSVTVHIQCHYIAIIQLLYSYSVHLQCHHIAIGIYYSQLAIQLASYYSVQNELYGQLHYVAITTVQLYSDTMYTNYNVHTQQCHFAVTQLQLQCTQLQSDQLCNYSAAHMHNYRVTSYMQQLTTISLRSYVQ